MRNPFGGSDQLGEFARKIIALYNVYCKSVTISLAETKAMANHILDGNLTVVMITDVMRRNRETKPISSDVFSLLSEQSLSVPAAGRVRIMLGSYVDRSAIIEKDVVIGMFAFVGKEAKIRRYAIVCNTVCIPPKTEVPEYTIVTDEPDTEDLVAMIKDFEKVLDVNVDKDELDSQIDEVLKSKE